MDSQQVRQSWADRSGEYSPDYYAYYGPDDASDGVLAAIEAVAGRDAAVLELGCSSGRHLAHLRDAGVRDVAGIEINSDAFGVMADEYPGLYRDGTFYDDAFQDVLPEFDDGGFDAAFSVETLQHVHPDDSWVFAELARVADAVVTVENESEDAGTVTYVHDDVPLYHRDWGDVFTRLGFEQTDCRQVGRDVLRCFRSA